MMTEFPLKLMAESGFQALFARKLAPKWAFLGMFELNQENFEGILA